MVVLKIFQSFLSAFFPGFYPWFSVAFLLGFFPKLSSNLADIFSWISSGFPSRFHFVILSESPVEIRSRIFPEISIGILLRIHLGIPPGIVSKVLQNLNISAVICSLISHGFFKYTFKNISWVSRKDSSRKFLPWLHNLFLLHFLWRCLSRLIQGFFSTCFFSVDSGIPNAFPSLIFPGVFLAFSQKFVPRFL